MRWEEINREAQKIYDQTPKKFRNMDNDSSTYLPLLETATTEIISTMRTNSACGAFIVLNQQDLSQDMESQTYKNKPGVYIRDYDPSTYPSRENSDLMAERMPEALVRKWNIGTDTSWREKFTFKDDEKEYYPFFYETYQEALEYPDYDWETLGYWSSGYTLDGDNNEVISYSVPLKLEDGTVYGVVGVEVTKDYLKKLVNYNELTEDSNASYVIGIKDKNQVKNVLINGPAFSMRGENKDEITLSNVNGYKNAYKFKDDSDQLIVSQTEALNLYHSNAPFSDQQWVLMGVVRQDQLFDFQIIFGICYLL
jgi:hypothetical protein